MTKTKKTNLSNRAINLLKSDNQTWYKGYVLGQWDNEFQTYFSIWWCFARIMESWGKSWEWRLEQNLEIMKQEFKDWLGLDEYKEEYNKAVETINDCINNAVELWLTRPLEAEKEVIIDIDENYSLKCKFDAFYGDHIMDHKTVSSFTKEEAKFEKYWQQAKLYQYAYYKSTGEKLPIKFQEIKKWKASIPREYKKEDLQKLVPEEKLEELKTVADLKEYLKLHPLKERIGNELVFERDETLVPFVEDLLKKAIVKAEWLKTLELEDIL